MAGAVIVRGRATSCVYGAVRHVTPALPQLVATLAAALDSLSVSLSTRRQPPCRIWWRIPLAVIALAVGVTRSQ